MDWSPSFFGGRVADITLWPIGGLARMTHLPEAPYQEFVMTAAGPAANILLAVLLAGVAVAWLGFDALLALALSPDVLRIFLSDLSAQTLLLLLIFNNVLLAVFNLIPAFPLDGGRMLRAVLTVILPYRKATAIASFIGQALALIFGIAALLSSNFTLGLIAVFVFFGAWQERTQVRYHASLHGFRARQAMQPVGVRLHPGSNYWEMWPVKLRHPRKRSILVVDGGPACGAIDTECVVGCVAESRPGRARPANTCDGRCRCSTLMMRWPMLVIGSGKIGARPGWWLRPGRCSARSAPAIWRAPPRCWMPIPAHCRKHKVLIRKGVIQ